MSLRLKVRSMPAILIRANTTHQKSTWLETQMKSSIRAWFQVFIIFRQSELLHWREESNNRLIQEMNHHSFKKVELERCLLKSIVNIFFQLFKDLKQSKSSSMKQIPLTSLLITIISMVRLGIKQIKLRHLKLMTNLL